MGKLPLEDLDVGRLGLHLHLLETFKKRPENSPKTSRCTLLTPLLPARMDRIGEDAAWEAGTLTAAEIEFLGEDELITVTPCFRMKAIKLMSVRVCESGLRLRVHTRCLATVGSWPETIRLTQGTYGPFIPSVPTEVPLWLAIQLKKAKQCKITPPEWLDPGIRHGSALLSGHASRQPRMPCEC